MIQTLKRKDVEIIATKEFAAPRARHAVRYGHTFDRVPLFVECGVSTPLCLNSLAR
jgi:hypothetical protein